MYSLDEIQKKITPILRRHGVMRASLFGSVVNGTMNEHSDVDLLVDMPPESSLLDRMKIKVEIEDTLGMPADVIRFEGIKQHARESILSSQVPLKL